MAKIGVGVGEDFPIDDKSDADGPDKDGPGASPGAGPGEGPGPHAYEAGDEPGFGGCGRGYRDWDRAEWRARRREWRRQRHEWRAEHREWRRRFKADLRDNLRRSGAYPFIPFVFPLVPILIGLAVLALLITGLVTIVASAPFVVLGLALLFVLYGAHRRHTHYDYDGRYYDATPTHGSSTTTAPPAQGQ